MKKIIPSRFEIKLALRSFSTRQKTVLAVLLLVFFVGLLGLWVELQKKFAEVVPVEGGTLREGVVGTPYLVNPILASTDADRDLTMLVYAGLMKSDGKGELEPELAESFAVSDDGLSYAFKLKENLYWHDGETLTSDDIVFTIGLAKNPATKSPIRANWEGVEIEATDRSTIIFRLKKPYAPFLENTTLGILPKHVWKNAAPEQFGLSEFNRQPVGAGPYYVKKVNRNSAGIITAYELKSFGEYALGKPLIPKIELFFYNSEAEMVAAFEQGALNSLGSLSTTASQKIRRSGFEIKTMTLPRIFGVFFNQNKSEALRNPAVRTALDMAVDKSALVRDVLGGFGAELNGPVPPGIIGEKEEIAEFNPEEAGSALEKDGWKYSEEKGTLTKKLKNKTEQELSLTISTANAPELVKTAELVKNMWQAIGVKTEIRLYEIGDLNQSVIRPRDYEGLLFGQVVGRDPDPFAFWHSSQRNDPGLNIALYANKTVDGILESARTINNTENREKKYGEFVAEIKKDKPAIFLYSPYYLYLVSKRLNVPETTIITTPAERFSNVNEWYLYTTRVWKIFVK